MRVVVIDYNGGNLASAAQAAKRAAVQRGIDANVIISRRQSDIQHADRLILPGQGAFADCARGLEEDGVRPFIEEATAQGTPFMGICVGMQLMSEYGLEHGRTEGLGWISGHVNHMIESKKAGLRLPHMGWNTLDFTPGAHPLTEGLSPGDHGYFVHSYSLHDAQESDIIASSSYGTRIPAIVARRNYCGTQFHVEKSQEVGLIILGNFLRWNPAP